MGKFCEHTADIRQLAEKKNCKSGKIAQRINALI